MDSISQDDNGGGRKMGLARLAKTRSLSSSLNSLPMEGKPEEKDDINNVHDTERSLDPSYDVQASPLRSLTKQNATVNLLPNKMNVSELSGQQACDRKGKGVNMEEDLVSLDSVGHTHVPCSDPDFIRNAKSGIRVNQCNSVTNQRDAAGSNEQQGDKSVSATDKDSPKIKRESTSSVTPKLSPLLSRRSRLAPPQIKRSSSMTRLTEAINQIHNLCVFPAQPVVVEQTCEGLSERTSHTSPSVQQPMSEVISSVTLTPLIVTSSRIDKVCTQSPKLSRHPAFRENLKENKKSCMDSHDIFASRYDRVPNSRTDLEYIIHSQSVCSPDEVLSSQPNSKVTENGFYAFPLRTKHQIDSAVSKASSTNCGLLDVGSSRNVNNIHRSHITKDEKKIRKKSDQRSTNILKNNSGPAELKHASTAPDRLANEDDHPFYSASCLQPELEQGFSSRSASWYGYKKTSVSSEGSEGGHEDHNLAESPLHTCRSASLDELNNIDHSYGLPIISPVDAKKKNYLFGGLSSLLGASELDRYFPTRSINIFIATWNMNGKEPPMNLEAFLLPEEMDHMPDMFVVGTQESGGSRSEWEVRLQATIGPSHVLFTSAIFGVLHLTIFLRRDLLWFCSVPEEATYSLRPGIAYKTKGGVGIGFQFFGTRILFINSHLTAHEEKQALRIQNFRNITRSLDLPRLLPHKHKHKDVTHRYDSVFWLGDLNFRLAVNRDHVFERLKKAGPETYQHLLQWDQLSQARHKGEAFSEFEEGPITFAPTFKYDPGTDHYDTSSKQRVPSYTDRILFKSNRGAITCYSYDSCPLFKTSDHKPVLGAFHCKIRPGKDDVPLAAGLFNRDVYLEALRRRRRFLYQPAMRNCPVQ
ncbi:uncharacterized protein INPP5E isoform X2 [Cherax quadricarinatus]|uniref:uncharacterized protein INPP5E isoform X2 n=1 Tax=Cherax quadricarinatus TaxID=27406 RepID=UPI0023787976|nr:uncharacterized protein LOC128695587 isoform X2 [Cherax quadricarinatus]